MIKGNCFGFLLYGVLGFSLACSSPMLSADSGHQREQSDKGVLRCGWFENPTPANAWLTDRDATWTIAIQGGVQAEGDWPTFKESRWVSTNGHYGHGCACLRVLADPISHEVRKILSGQSRPLDVCRKDRALSEPK